MQVPLVLDSIVSYTPFKVELLRLLFNITKIPWNIL